MSLPRKTEREAAKKALILLLSGLGVSLRDIAFIVGLTPEGVRFIVSKNKKP